VALTAFASFAASDILFEPTGANTSISSGNGHWQNDWGPAFGTFSFDPAQPPPSGATGGSVYIQGNWTEANTGGWDDMMACWRGGWYDAPADNFDGALYEALILDIKYDTNSTIPAASANWGIGLDQGWANTQLTNYSFASDDAWHHVIIPIPASMANIGSTCGIGFYSWKPGGTVGTLGFWVANVQLVARAVAIPPPSVSLNKVVAPGLVQFADLTPNYNRQDIRTDTSGNAQVDWYGQTKPVTYSWKIADFPGPGHAGFFTSVAITPDPVGTVTYADPDWSSTNALFVNIVAQANGSVRASISFKTNQPSNNTQYDTTGRLVGGANSLAAPSAIGTWSLRFNSDTDMVLTAPNGAYTNASLPPDVASAYTGVSFVLMSGMSSAANVGQSITYSALDITGVVTPVHEDFTSGALSSPFMALMSQGYLFPWNLNPPNQVWATPDAKYWLHHSLPDTGFTPVSSPTLPGSLWDWSDRGLGAGFLNGSERWNMVNSSNLPSASKGFFAELKRVPTKLQVLLPSETGAPGTVSGKTGTVDSVSVGYPVTVTVNSVDAAWYVRGGALGDTIDITTTDGTAQLPADAALSSGTKTFTVFFNTPGTYTVTATDVTTGTITPGTSASITVTP